MGKRRERELLWLKVSTIEKDIWTAHEAVTGFGRVLVVEGVDSSRSAELYDAARGKVQQVAGQVDRLGGDCSSATPPYRREVSNQGLRAAAWLGDQVLALNFMVEAMPLVGPAEGDDEAFLVSSISAADECYRHALFIIQAMMVSDSRATLTLAQLKRDGHPGAEVDIKGLTAELGAVQARLAESP